MTLQPPQSDQLDELLTTHLVTTLDPQRGRAAAAFRAHLAKQQEAPVPIPISRGVVPRRALWYWASVPSLVAAGLAVAITLQVAKQPTVTPTPPDAAGPKVADAVAPKPTGNIVWEQMETSRPVLGPVTVMNGTPVQVVGNHIVRESHFFDPKEKAVYSITEEPVENVGYMKLQPN